VKGERSGSPPFSCPIPIQRHPRVLMAHGGGGELSRQLAEAMFLPSFANPALEERHDGALLDLTGSRIAFTTDSYVVRPLFFPGGDIGRLAVNGTVNDLAMCGARPLYLSVGLILEEGLEMETLWRVTRSLAEAAEGAGVQLVTGDTKVVDHGKGDGIFINTAGVGVVEQDRAIAPRSVRPGDQLLLSGDLGRHGIAILAAREGLEFETAIASDCASLAPLVLQLLSEGVELHCLRDLTRGGLASALVEVAAAAGLSTVIREDAIPVLEEVQGACEMLGFDPMYVANEGRFVAFVPERDAVRALEIMRGHPLGAGAARIGAVEDDARGVVRMITRLGTARIVEMLSGEQLPRIC
jgi:hydrogenase expression/formation protein HypE